MRPQGLALGVTKSDGTTALNNASPSTGTPSLTAGADFLIAATGVAGYNGEPVIKRTVDDQTVVFRTGYFGSILSQNSPPKYEDNGCRTVAAWRIR